jgi:hypothetical protein
MKSYTLLVASSDVGLDVSAVKTTYLFLCFQRNSGQNHYVKLGNESFESMAKFKYFKETPDKSKLHL